MFPNAIRLKKMCDEADTYPSTIKFVLECYKTKRMCHRAIYRCFFVFDSISDKYKIQEITFSLYFAFIVYCLCEYITQEMNLLMILYQHLNLFPIGLLQVK